MSNYSVKKQTLGIRFVKQMRKYWILYVMSLPVVIYFLICHYYPMYDITLAFKDFNAKAGITASPWVGFK